MHQISEPLTDEQVQKAMDDLLERDKRAGWNGQVVKPDEDLFFQMKPAPLPKKKLLIHRFPGNGSERMECTDWIVKQCVGYKDSPDIEMLFPKRVQDTPIDMCRNLAVMKAKSVGADYLVMVDNDIEPDYEVPGVSGYPDDANPAAKQFLASSLKFLKQLDRPAIIAAPYCGPPPAEFVYVFDWNWTGDVRRPNFKAKLDMIERNDAAHRVGIQQVAALPTGLMLIDMRVFDIMPGPWFYYETATPEWSKKASTEDVTFSRDCAVCRIPVYCNWDSWARHWKTIGVGRPLRASMDVINPKLHKIVTDGYDRRDRRVDINLDGEPYWPESLPDKKSEMPVEPDSKKATPVAVG